MLLLQQSEATSALRRGLVYLVDATNGYTPEPGLSSGWTIEVSKNGASQGAGSGSITEIGDGHYYYEFTAGELDTVGFVSVSIRHASCRDFVLEIQVVPWDPYDDISTGINNIEAKIPTNYIMGSSVQSDKDDELDAIYNKLPSSTYIMGSAVATGKDDEIDQIITDIAALNDIAAADVWAVGTRALTDKAGFTISGTTQTFDALDTLLDSAHGAGSWAAAVGFSTHSAADVWTAGSRALSTPNDYKATGFSTHTAAAVWAVGTRSLTDKAGFTISGTITTLDGLNNFDNTSDQVIITTNNDKTGYSLTSGERDNIADSVWDEDIVAAHGAADGAGLLLRVLGDAISDRSNNATLNALLGVADVASRDIPEQVWNEGTRDITGGTVDTATSVTNDVGITQAGADKVWSTTTRSLTDKAGFTISGTTQTFDALDTLLDGAHGAGSWASAVGFSTHSAADVWTTGSRELSTPANYMANVASLALEATVAALNDLSSSDIQTVLENNDLDHLIQVTAGAEEPTIGSYLDQIMHKDGSQTFSQTTDALEALRDNQGGGGQDWTSGERENIRDALGVTGTKTAASGGDIQSIEGKIDGLNDITAASVWAVATRLLSGTTGNFDALDTLLDTAHGAGSWLTGGGGSGISIQTIPSIPKNIDLASTKTVRIALYVNDQSDDLPTTGEITPGTIKIDRSADGGTSWSTIRNDVACSEHAGGIYYDEIFSSGNGYASADMIRITFKGQIVTIAANNFEITDGTNGMVFITRMDSGLSGGGPSAGDIADAVWDEPIVDHTNSAQFGGKNQLVVPSETLSDYKATGFSTHTAADIWSVGSRALTDKAGFTISGTTQTFDALDTLLDSAHGAGSWASAVGFSTHSAANVWAAGSRELSTPANYMANVSALALEATVAALNDLSSSDVQSVLEDNDLDHLAKLAHPSGDPVADTLFDLIMNKDGSQTFDRSTDSLEILGEGGGGGATAQQVWEYATGGGRTLSTPGDYMANVTALALEATVNALNDIAAADVWTAGSRELSTPNNYKADVSALATSGALATVDSNVDSLVLQILRENTAQGGTASSITLDTGANAIMDFYIHAMVIITSGTGAGQSRTISAYNGGTKVASVSENWKTNPTTGSGFQIIAWGNVHVDEIHQVALDSIADALWDELKTSHTGDLKTMADNLDQSLTTTETNIITEIDANETKIDTLQSDVTTIKTKTDNLPTNTTTELQRILGLTDENSYIDQYTKDGSNRMTGCRKRTYNSKANAVAHGATGLIATYAVTVDYSGAFFNSYLMTLE